MTPSDVGRLTGTAPGMLEFFALVGSWIGRGDGRRAYLALASVFGHRSFAWAVTEVWPYLVRFGPECGWTPEFWACANAIMLVRDWRSRDWTHEIRRWCGEFGDIAARTDANN